jgi:hypothetical protein
MTTHVMLDVETLGLRENTVVLSIGACVFDSAGLGADFYIELSPDRQHGSIDLSTIRFWLNQESKGIQCPISGTASVQEAIVSLGEFLGDACQGEYEDLVIWANGIDFDLPKVTNLYNYLGLPVPWKYNAVRDARTIYKTFALYGTKPEHLAKHNALADAQYQASYLASIFNNLQELCDVSNW